MITQIPLLQNVRVASPCDANWDDMDAIDGDRVRHCQGCRKNVYNLSAMSQAEAEGLLRAHEGRLCVRYYQRRDGTVLTGDCPIGMKAAHLSLIRRSAVAAGLFAMLFSAMAAVNMSERRAMEAPVPPTHPVLGGISRPVDVTPPKQIIADPRPYVTMGAVAISPQDRLPKPEYTPQRQHNPAPPAHPVYDPNTATEKDSTDDSILKPWTLHK